jgi:hypothetical protein
MEEGESMAAKSSGSSLTLKDLHRLDTPRAFPVNDPESSFKRQA